MKKTILFISLCLLLAACGNKQQGGETLSTLEMLNSSPEVSKWYQVAPEGAVDSRGDQWRGLFKKGSENKVLLMFCGGGVSVDEYSAARGSTVTKDSYYMDRISLFEQSTVNTLPKTLGKDSVDNPFNGWTFLFLPYTTGDFHCGTGDFEYTDLNGEKQILHHHGYTNYRKFMEQVLPLLGTPEALVITGFSAGGFGTSILSDDVISLFPNTENVTVCVDASLLVWDGCADVAKNVWKAPEAICNQIEGDNIMLSCLESLHQKRPSAKILFGVSTYDQALSLFQTYFDTGVRRLNDRESLDAFHNNLKATVAEFQEQIPEGGLFIWNDHVVDEELGVTLHTIEFDTRVLQDLGGHGSFAKWIHDAVEGNINTYGLELL